MIAGRRSVAGASNIGYSKFDKGSQGQPVDKVRQRAKHLPKQQEKEAKANKPKKIPVTIEKPPKAYMDELNAAIAADREALGKKPFDRKNDDEPSTTQIRQSRSNPESGRLHKEGKPDGFHYSEHRTVNSQNHIVDNGLLKRFFFHLCSFLPLKNALFSLENLALFSRAVFALI